MIKFLDILTFISVEENETKGEKIIKESIQILKESENKRFFLSLLIRDLTNFYDLYFSWIFLAPPQLLSFQELCNVMKLLSEKQCPAKKIMLHCFRLAAELIHFSKPKCFIRSAIFYSNCTKYRCKKTGTIFLASLEKIKKIWRRE